MMEVNKLEELQKKIYEIAKSHGWHEAKLSAEHYLCLIMTEMSEAVEADRKNRRAQIEMFKRESVTQQAPDHIETHWKFCFEQFIKDTVEDEFADIIIRLLDMAQAIHGEKMSWVGYFPYGMRFNPNKSFSESAWLFVTEVLNCGYMNIFDSVRYIEEWANHLGIDIEQHILWKMSYNEMRPYKHGGKKY